jgi:hypothetical protein
MSEVRKKPVSRIEGTEVLMMFARVKSDKSFKLALRVAQTLSHGQCN